MSKEFDVFISYKREEHHLVQQLAAALEDAGYSHVSDGNLENGQHFPTAIAKMINSARLVVVLWTRKSVQSHWVIDEANLAQKLDVYFGVLVEEADLPLGLAGVQVENISDQVYSEALPQVIGAIREKLGATEVSADIAAKTSTAFADDFMFYQVATRLDTAEAYQTYLSSFPKGLMRAEAESELRLKGGLKKPEQRRGVPWLGAGVGLVAGAAAVAAYFSFVSLPGVDSRYSGHVAQLKAEYETEIAKRQEVEAEAADLTKSLESEREALRRLDAKNNLLDGTIEGLRADLKTLESQLAAAGDKQTDTETRLEQALGQRLEAQNKLNALIDSHIQIKEENLALVKRIEGLQADLAQMTAERQKYLDLFEETDVKTKSLERSYSNLKSHTRDLLEKNDSLSIELENAREDVARWIQQSDEFENELHELAARENQLNRQIAVLKSDVEELAAARVAPKPVLPEPDCKIDGQLGYKILDKCRSVETRILQLHGTDISDTTPIAGLTKLRSLSLWRTPVKDIAPLSTLDHLIVLSIDASKVTDISPLTGITSLQWLNLRATRVRDFSPLGELNGLRVLGLSNTAFSDLNLIEDLVFLEELNLQGTLVKDFTVLQSFKRLSMLTTPEGKRIGDSSGSEEALAAVRDWIEANI